jgi:hypothetical protein
MATLAELKAKIDEARHIINHMRHVGRPQTEGVLENETALIASFQNGLNITQACLQVGIQKTQYYREIKRNKRFSDKMALAQQFATTAARHNIVVAINNKDVATSKWYLERKDPEYKPKSDVTSDGLPVPILGGASVSVDNSTSKIPEAQ